MIQHGIAIIIVNWNGWKDTVLCLESLLPLLPERSQVIICDNASNDGSLDNIRKWANNSCQNIKSSNNQSQSVSLISYTVIDRSLIEKGGHEDDPSLVLIDTGKNLGFAGGNNIGLRYALARGYQLFWILNNDTVVAPNALQALIERMNEDSKIGMCGSTLLYFDQPEIVQALGGSIFFYEKAIGHHIGNGTSFELKHNRTKIEAQLDYVVGASMMVTREFLEKIGLMDEGYFLYFEEIDWAQRAKGLFKLAWAPESIVFHKEGASIGSSHRSRPSNTSLRYISKNRLRFTALHQPKKYWTVWRHLVFDALVYAKRGDFYAVFIILKSLLTGLQGVRSANAQNGI